VLVVPTVQNGIAFESHEAFRMHHVVAARQRGWSCNVQTRYTDVNRFALRCSHGMKGTGPSCSYMIVVERQLINGDMVWIAVRETVHENHEPSTVGTLGKFKTDAVESRRKDVELSDQEDSGLNAEAIQSDPNQKRSRDKPTSPPTRFDEKKRPRIRSVSPPPKSRNAVASTSGSNSRSMDPASSILQPFRSPIPRVSPTPHWSRVQYQPQPAHHALPIPAQFHPRYHSHPTPPASVPSLLLTRRSTHERTNNFGNDRSFSVAEGTGYAYSGHAENFCRNHIIRWRSDPFASTLNSVSPSLPSLPSPSHQPAPIDVPVEKLAHSRKWAFAPATPPSLAPLAASSTFSDLRHNHALTLGKDSTPSSLRPIPAAISCVIGSIGVVPYEQNVSHRKTDTENLVPN
jgi:hypothetical protein